MGREKKVKFANDLEPEPPDSGFWAWMVLGSAFAVHFMVVGFRASMSVYVYVWIGFFDGSAAETSLVISLCSFMSGASSPIAGSICKRFGPRVTAMAGITVTCVGIAISSQATSVIFLIISLGFFTAFGMSMALNAAYTALGMYFKKRLALVIGLASTGTSIGQLSLPPLLQYLIDQYGWRGSLVIVSALAFHAVAAVALIRPLAPQKQKRSPKKSRGSKREDSTSDATTSKNCQSTEVGRNGLSFLNPSVLGGEDFVCSQGGSSTLGEGSIFQGEPDFDMITDETEEEDRIEYVDSDSLSLSSTSEENMTAMNNNVWVSVAIMTTMRKERRRSSFIPGSRRRSVSMLSQTLVKSTSDLNRLLHNPSFLVVMATTIAQGFGWASTVFHMVSRAESINIEPDSAALLLTLTGAGSLIGRLAMGWVVDKNWMRPEPYYTVMFSVCALATFITPLVTEFKVLVAISLVQGASFGSATVVILSVPRLVVKPSLTSSAMAYFLLAWGVGEICGGALAGWFYDAFQSYDYSFYTAGSVMTSGCGLMLIIYFLQRAKRQRQGHYTTTFKEQAGPVQPGLNQLDPELGGYKQDDLGRVNPVFSMRQGFETPTDQCEGEIMGEGVPVSEVDANRASQYCQSMDGQRQSNAVCDQEKVKQARGGSLKEGWEKVDVEESLGIENTNQNCLVVAQASYALPSQSDTDAEVHKQEIDESVTPISAQILENISMGDFNNRPTYKSDEEGVMCFENPCYEGAGAYEFRIQESRKVEGEFSGVDIACESLSDHEDVDNKNQLYFAQDFKSECSTYDPESVSSDRWGGVLDTESDMGVPQSNHPPQIAHQNSVDNKKQGRSYDDPDEDEHYSDNIFANRKTTDRGVFNPCYISDTLFDGGPEVVEGSLDGQEDEVSKSEGEKNVAKYSCGGKKQYIVSEELFL